MIATTTATRGLLLALAIAVAFSLTAAVSPISGPLSPPPAIAAQIEADAGTFTGTAEVAKAFEYCRYNNAKPKLVEWQRKPLSPGLGLPDPLAEKKNGWWGLTTEVESVTKGIGTLSACGFLTAMTAEDGVQLGAACGASKGWNGIGTIDWANGAKTVGGQTVGKPKTNGVTQLEDIGWKVSVGGTLPVTANMVDPKNKSNKIGFLEATVQASGGLECLEKGPQVPDEKGNPKDGGPRPNQGANFFTVNGAYEAIRHYGKEPVPHPDIKKDDSEDTKKDDNRPHTK